MGVDDRAHPHPTGDLTEQDRQILALVHEALDPGEMENRIHGLGLSPTRYHQRLNQLIDTEAALAAYPTAVNRLLRVRANSRRWTTR